VVGSVLADGLIRGRGRLAGYVMCQHVDKKLMKIVVGPPSDTTA
jgi:hypothetical protein